MNLCSLIVLCVLACSALAQDEECRLDLAIALDGSGSIEVDNPVSGNWAKVIEFMVGIVDGFDVGTDATRIAIVRFDESATLEFDLDDHATKAATRANTQNITYRASGGRTNTQDALETIRDEVFIPANGDRPDVPNLVILFTDGDPTPILNPRLNETIADLKSDDVRIIGIGVTGVTGRINEDFMRFIVTDPSTDYFEVEDFEFLAEILDGIIAQSCSIITNCLNEADIYFAVDGSGSIKESDFGLMRDFMASLVDQLAIDSDGVRAGMVLFGENAEMLYDLDDFNTRDAMMEFINTVRYPRGTTRTERAIQMIREQGFVPAAGDRENVINIILLITDGNSNNPGPTFEQIYLAKQEGVHVITVGIGNWLNELELKLLSSYPYDANYVHVENYAGLNEGVRLTLTNLLCDNVDDCRTDPCQNGGTCIDKIGMYICECVNGFSGRNCERECREPADVSFALDGSGSVGADNFLLQIDFVRELAFGINVGQSLISGIQYANDAEIQFYLSEFIGDKKMILDALSMLYMKGTSNTAAAINIMRTDVFNFANGDRGEVLNVGVVMLDSRSNNFEETWNASRLIRIDATQMIAVGIGNNLRQTELEAIASYPWEQTIIRPSGFNTLLDSVDDILEALCNNVDSCNPNPCENGGECFDLLGGYECICQDEYSGRNCERGCEKTYDIVLAIDVSGSIRRERLPQVINFITDLVAEFEVSDLAAHFAAVSFSEDVNIEFNLNSYGLKQDVITALRTIQYRGGRTDIASALETIRDQMFTPAAGDRSEAQNFILLLTDGASTMREDDVMPVAIETKIDGVKIMTVGIGNAVNRLELEGMTTKPDGTMMMMAESFNTITNDQQARQTLLNNIIDATCNDVFECEENPCDRGQCFDDLHSYYCDCESGWSGENCDRECTRSMDVVFVLDFSGSMDQVLNVVIAFTREVVQGLPFTNSRVRVGLVGYHDDATVHFELDDYTTKQEVLTALSFSRYGGRTNTQSALNMMYNDVFRSDRGDRNGVDNIAIVVTDGGSNIQRDQTISQANEARNRGIEVYVAALYNNPDMGEVNGIASDPDNEYMVLVPSPEQVSAAASDLLDRLCSN